MKKLTYCLLFFFILLPATLAQVSFVKTEGPYGGGGQLVIDGNDNLYCSTSGGLYISTNNGDNWQCIKEDFYDVPICVNKEGVIVAISGETIFLSKDKGKSWEQKGRPFPSPRLMDMAIDSKNNIFIGTEKGLYVSNNEGSTFAQIGAVYKWVNSIVIDKKDIVYVATAEGVFCSSDGGKIFKDLGLDVKYGSTIAVNLDGDIFALGSDGLFCYSIKNKKWNQINNKEGERFIFGDKILIDYKGRIYVLQFGEGGGLTVMISNDNGKTWDVTGSHCGISLDVRISHNKGKTWSFPHSFLSRDFVYNSQGQIFLSDNSHIYMSTDSGENWTICNNGITSGYIQDIRIDPFGPWYVNSSGDLRDLLKSLDKGKNWISIMGGWGSEQWSASIGEIFLNSIGTVYLNVFLYDEFFYSNSDEDYYEDRGYEILSYTDNGNIWETIRTDFKIEVSSFGIDYKNNIYLGFNNEKKIYRIKDKSSKLIFFCNLPTELKGEFYVEILFKKNDIYLVSHDALYLSSDQGKKWNKLNLIPTIRDVEITQNGDIFALITNSEEKSSIYLSKDNGKNWEKFLELPENMGSINCFLFDDEGYLLCGTSGRGLWKSEKPVLK